MDNNEEIKITDTPIEVPVFKKNLLFDPDLDFDPDCGFIPFNEF